MSAARVVYFDCASGAAGDMLLGAVVDLGLPIAQLREELSKLPLAGFRLDLREGWAIESSARVTATGESGPRSSRGRRNGVHLIHGDRHGISGA